ncbi:MAG: hypothetical protein B1H07_01705 [Campylobacteraceae bacterium 4484_166]|nr:MAG: hypothetical protein B1H07_01705 [Campylobacteraceae bacterium 4484_166]
MDYKAIAKQVIEIEAQELKNLSNNLTDGIEKAVELIYNTKGKLVIIGVGKSGLVGAKISATFASTGTSSFFIHPTEAMHGDLGAISKDDTVMAISYSGESEELVLLIPHLKRLNIPLIAIAKDISSTLGQNCDIFLPIAVTKEACPLNIAPTSSTTITMALGDAIAVCMMKKRNFKKEDFASFHPGGTLGKKLFVKIDDIMRKTDLPIVPYGTSIKNAILKMSEGRLGSVIVVDKNEKVKSVLSDGDLRRALLQDSFSLDKNIETISTKNPITIKSKEILASEVLQIVEKHKIQLLIITDEFDKIEGVVHLHDLVEAGIK